MITVFPCRARFVPVRYVRTNAQLSVLPRLGGFTLAHLNDGYTGLQITDIINHNLTNHFELIDLKHWRVSAGMSPCPSATGGTVTTGLALTRAETAAATPSNPRSASTRLASLAATSCPCATVRRERPSKAPHRRTPQWTAPHGRPGFGATPNGTALLKCRRIINMDVCTNCTDS